MNTSDNKYQKLLQIYKEHCKSLAESGLGSLGEDAAKDYPARMNSLYQQYGTQLIGWINSGKKELLKKKLEGDKSATSKMSAINHFGTFLKSYQNGVIRMNCTINDLDLAQIIASVAIFPQESVVRKVIQGKLGSKNNIGNGNPFASLDHCQRQRKKGSEQIRGHQVGNPVDSSFGPVYYDDNSTANRLFKIAIRESISDFGIELNKNSDFKDYHVCHIWDEIDTPNGKIKSVYDNRYFTSVINMVLVPSCVSGITDHNDYVKDVLRYRVVELYGELCQKDILVLPQPIGSIVKPKNYDKIKWS